jgi:hypothetical protein
MRARCGLAVVAAVAAALGSSPARADTNCKFGNELIAPGKAMCLNGFATTCRPNGAWAVDRHAPCFSGVSARRACIVSAVEVAAPGARLCRDGRVRQCSERGDWIDLAAGC